MSLFQLPVAPPAPDHGVSSMYMQKVEPNQPILQNVGFGTQKIQYQINPASNEWFIPNRSYFRIRFSVTQSLNNAATEAKIGSAVSDTAGAGVMYRWVPAYGLGARLFNGCNFYVGSTLVSSINSNLPQVDALHKRTTLSRSQLDTSEGLYQSDPRARLAQLFGIPLSSVPANIRDAKQAALPSPADSQSEFEIIWSPPLGVMDIAHGLPSGQYRWEFNGNPNFLYDVVDGLDEKEARNPTLTAALTGGKQYLFVMRSMVLYACYARGPSGEDTKFALNMRQIRVQNLDMTPGSDVLALKNFDVDSDTSALAIAVQGASNQSGTNIFGGPSLFRINDPAGSGFVLNLQRALKRWYISYDNSIYPPEQNEDAFSTAEQQMMQRYRDTHTQTGMIYSPGSAESLSQWLTEAGPYYLVNWPRIQGTATRVQVNLQLNSSVPFQVLLISISEQSYLIRTSDGKVRKVEMGE